MMKTARGRAFEKYEPTLTPDDVSHAKASNQAAVSLKAVPVPNPNYGIEFIAVKFALADGAFSIVLLDHFCARALAASIEMANKLNWSAATVIPSETKH
jgi:hypothetical protein